MHIHKFIKQPNNSILVQTIIIKNVVEMLHFMVDRTHLRVQAGCKILDEDQKPNLRNQRGQPRNCHHLHHGNGSTSDSYLDGAMFHLHKCMGKG